MTFPVSWHPNVKISQLADFMLKETRKITIGTHSGTHVDVLGTLLKMGPC